jgi:hypothetical protein
MPPIVIVITRPAVVALAVLLAAVVVLRMALNRRTPLPRRHGLRELE